MTILSYSYEDVDQPGWKFSKITLGKLNLLVGATGSGKTRLLNTIFNLSLFAVGKKAAGPGKWDIEIEQNGDIYNWTITIIRINSDSTEIGEERISKVTEEEKITIVERDKSKFIFDGDELPKLPRDIASISLLKDETLIEPLRKLFGRVLRRYFSEYALGETVLYGALHEKSIKEIEKEKSISNLFGAPYGISSKLWLLKQFFPETYSYICDYYTSTFPFISRVDVKDLRKEDGGRAFLNLTPAFCIKEKNVKEWIFLQELSSGMQKVLLLLTDLCTMPAGGTYLIDEYENSLGINAIDSFPDFLMEFETDAQIIITSHHPYIINNIHPKDWFVLHRKGGDVKIKYGSDLLKGLGKSKQQYFIQLINDPFYTEGVE